LPGVRFASSSSSSLLLSCRRRGRDLVHVDDAAGALPVPAAGASFSVSVRVELTSRRRKVDAVGYRDHVGAHRTGSLVIKLKQ
jgi:hypothetical protein